jgi:hypothetical protein
MTAKASDRSGAPILRGRFLFLILCGLFSSAPHAETAVTHANKTDYIPVATGRRMVDFSTEFPGFTVKEAGNFLDYERRAKRDISFFNTRRTPGEKKFFDRFLRVIGMNVYRSPESGRCDFPAEAISLQTGVGRETRETLYAYSFLVCADDMIVTPQRMLDKYIEKYGPYDKRDYDRDQNYYYNVSARYTVSVKAVTSLDSKAALIITIVDEDTFSHAYIDARTRTRSAEGAASGKF